MRQHSTNFVIVIEIAQEIHFSNYEIMHHSICIRFGHAIDDHDLVHFPVPNCISSNSPYTWCWIYFCLSTPATWFKTASVIIWARCKEMKSTGTDSYIMTWKTKYDYNIAMWCGRLSVNVRSFIKCIIILQGTNAMQMSLKRHACKE